MEYKIVKTKGDGYKKYGLIYTTILYEIENAPDITELYVHQKQILSRILESSGNQLYALVSCLYPRENEDASTKYRLWGGLKPIDDEEFDMVEHAEFTNTLFEDKIVGTSCILWNGLAQIDPDFYIRNYMFFNDRQMRFLLIAHGEQVAQIRESVNRCLSGLAEISENVYKKELLLLLQDLDCIVVEAQDDAHEGSLMFYVNGKSKYCELMDCIFGCV